jgi:REP-associated tyrosine transposase
MAWALMDNHFHLFLHTLEPNLSDGMHDLNSGYVTGFNRRHSRHGPLLQGRFKSILVEPGYHYWELTRYVHLNPVRAGLAGEPEHYPWSSCLAYFRSQAAPEWLAWEEVLALHGPTLRTARRAYRKFLMAGLDAPDRPPTEQAVAGTVLGSSVFLDRIKTWLGDRLPDREVPAARQLRHTVSLQDVAEAVCLAYDVSEVSLEQRGRPNNHPRSVAIYLSRRLTQASIEEIGIRFGGVQGSAVSHTVGKVADTRAGDRSFDRQMAAIEAGLTDSSFKT